MNKFKFTGKMLIFLILACSVFNFIIRWDSNVGFFSLLITFLFLAVMINYTVFKLEVSHPDKKVRGALIFYFALTGASGLLNFIINAASINVPEVSKKLLEFLVSPYSGLNFVLRFENFSNLASLILGSLFIYLIINLTDDDLEEFRKMQELEESDKENKEDNE